MTRKTPKKIKLSSDATAVSKLRSDYHSPTKKHKKKQKPSRQKTKQQTKKLQKGHSTH